MVGVPGRSNACHTCRQRRIRCGGEKPTCFNCAKSRRPCGGYQKKQAFIMSGYMTDSNSPLINSGLTGVSQDGTAPVLLHRWKKNEAALNPSLPATENAPLIPSMPTTVTCRNVFRDQLLGLFFDLQCPSAGGGVTRFNGHCNWLLQLPNIQLSAALEHALMANCWSKLGRQSGHEALVRDSLSQYTAGLHQLQRAISNTESRFSEQNIASCVALIMYEFAECPGSATDAYMNHYNGAMRLMHRRGPEAHATGLAHGILQVMRMHTFYQSLGQRRRSFLTQPEWIQKPWATSRKASHDLLVDILLHIPSIFENIDAGKATSSPEMAIRCKLSAIKECLRLDKQLDDWFSSYRAAAHGPLYWPNLSTTGSASDDPGLGKLFPVSFEFPSFGVGETLVLFWTAQVLIHSHLTMLSRELSGTEAHPRKIVGEDVSSLLVQMEDGTLNHSSIEIGQTLHSPGRHQEWVRASASYICQSVEYFLREKLFHLGAGVVLPPLMVVQSCLSMTPGDWSREMVWIREKVGIIRDTGVNLAGQL